MLQVELQREQHAVFAANDRGHVVLQIAVRDNVEPVRAVAEPVHNLTADLIPARKHRRVRHNVLWRQIRLLRQRRIRPHQRVPRFRHREVQKIILADFHRLQQQADVQRAAFNALLNVIGVAAINAVRHVRVLGAKRR